MNHAEKLQQRCIHFTGLMDKVCKAGVDYKDIRTDEPLCIPCISTGGECSKAQFRTREEAERESKEMEEAAAAGIAMYLLVKDHHKKTGKQFGEIDCHCGGTIRFNVASNGHIRASCNSCKSSFIQ